MTRPTTLSMREIRCRDLARFLHENPDIGSLYDAYQAPALKRWGRLQIWLALLDVQREGGIRLRPAAGADLDIERLDELVQRKAAV